MIGEDKSPQFSHFPLLPCGTDSTAALLSHPTSASKSSSRLHPQRLARCSLWPRRQLLKAHPSRKPFLVAKRKEAWLIPTCPNTVLPHLSPCLPCLRKPQPLCWHLTWRACFLMQPVAGAAGPVCVCTWSPSPDSQKEDEVQRPQVSPLWLPRKKVALTFLSACPDLPWEGLLPAI